MDMGQHIGAFAQHGDRIIAEIEGMRRAIQELDTGRVHRADQIDRGLQGLGPVLGVGFDMQIDAFLLEDRHQFFHAAPPGILASLDHAAGVAAIAAALVGMGAATEFAVHGVHTQFDRDFDGAFPVADGRLPLDLVIGGPAIHRQQRGDADLRVRQRPFEVFHPVGKNAGRLEPFQKIGAGRQFDPLIAQLGHLGGQLFQRQMAVHEGVQGDFHLLSFASVRSGLRA